MTTTETKEITNSDDVIDVRDVIARVEELEGEPTLNDIGECDDCGVFLKRGDEDHGPECRVLELQRLNALLDELRGNGGDEEWRGDWYPITLVRDSYFEDFARDEAEQLGLIDDNAKWPYTCIDWERAAEELQQDYSTCDFDGVEYHYR